METILLRSINHEKFKKLWFIILMNARKQILLRIIEYVLRRINPRTKSVTRSFKIFLRIIKVKNFHEFIKIVIV